MQSVWDSLGSMATTTMNNGGEMYVDWKVSLSAAVAASNALRFA